MALASPFWSLPLPLAYVAVPKGRTQHVTALSTCPSSYASSVHDRVFDDIDAPLFRVSMFLFPSLPVPVLSRQPCASRPLLSLCRSSLVHGRVFSCAASSSWLSDALVLPFPSFAFAFVSRSFRFAARFHSCKRRSCAANSSAPCKVGARGIEHDTTHLEPFDDSRTCYPLFRPSFLSFSRLRVSVSLLSSPPI